MSNAPLPSTLCLLSNLPKRPVGDKVRFLGCVATYSTDSASLTLEHDCPKGNRVKAVVDVNLLLQNLKSEQTNVGQWVHVIGYTTSFKISSDKTITAKLAKCQPTFIGVQALVMWIAEDVDIPLYEKTFLPETG